MTANYSEHFAKRGPTDQKQPIPGREAEMAKNNAGGFTFQVDDWARLDRFLILGAEGNTYYVTEKKMTVDNANVVLRCLRQDGARTVARIAEISDAGRAPKNDPALFALALAASDNDTKTRQLALAALPKVARIPTHLFHFATFVDAQRGWGRALRRAVGNWYNLQPTERLANQVAKYQQRDGWSNRDLLRLSHPKTFEATRAGIYNWACGRKNDTFGTPALLMAYDALVANPSAEAAVAAIHEHRLPRECIPTELLNDPDVWAALLEAMPLNAMIRNLGKMSAVGLLKPLASENAKVVEALGNVEAIRKARLHPLAILVALKTYSKGRGDKGSLTWTPVPQIVDALDSAFYTAFDAVEPTGKRILMGLDVSGSMTSPFAGGPLTSCEAVAAMAMTFARTEKQYYVHGFAGTFKDLKITAKDTLQSAMKKAQDQNFGTTDCSLPMTYALANKLEVDAFMVMTDNETYGGRSHPTQALERYRQATGIESKMVVVATSATNFSIADPKDPGMMDVAGFDTAVPQIISDFIRG